MSGRADAFLAIYAVLQSSSRRALNPFPADVIGGSWKGHKQR